MVNNWSFFLEVFIEKNFSFCWLLRGWASKCHVRKRAQHKRLFLFRVVDVRRPNIVMDESFFMESRNCFYQMLHKNIKLSNAPWNFVLSPVLDDQGKIDGHWLEEDDFRVMSYKFVFVDGFNGIISNNFVKIWRIKLSYSFICVYLIKGIHKFLALEVIEVSDE